MTVRNGKGSTPRPADLRRFGDNYDRIFGKQASAAEPEDDRPWLFDFYQGPYWEGPYPSRQAAIAAAMADESAGLIEYDRFGRGTFVYVARGGPLVPLLRSEDADVVLEIIRERACEHGEEGQEWEPALGRSQKQQLLDCIGAWLDEALPPEGRPLVADPHTVEDVTFEEIKELKRDR